METTDLVERAEILIGRAVKQNPPRKGEGYVLTWKQAEAAVLGALAGVPAFQARVEKLEVALKTAALDLHEAAGRFVAIKEVDPQGCSELTREAARRADAALEEDYCGIVEVNEEDFRAEGERG